MSSCEVECSVAASECECSVNTASVVSAAVVRSSVAAYPACWSDWLPVESLWSVELSGWGDHVACSGSAGNDEPVWTGCSSDLTVVLSVDVCLCSVVSEV